MKTASTAGKGTSKKAAAKSSKTRLKVREAKRSSATATKSKSKPPKKIAIKNKTSATDRVEKKLSKVEAFHSGKKSRPSVPAAKRADLSLVPLSPFRFPIDTNRVATQVARFAGLAFVLAGAAVGLLYTQLLNLPIAATTQQGQVVSSLSGPENARQNPDTTRPTALFTVDTTEPLAGNIRINVAVTDAESVTLTAFFEEWDRNLTLGKARKEGGVWVYDWNTSQYENGRYKLKALVRNQAGTYEQVSNATVTVNNVTETLNDLESVAEVDAEPLTVTLSTDATTVALSYLLPEIESSDIVRIYIKNVLSDTVQLVDTSYLFAKSYNKTNVLWRHSLNVERFAAGQYQVVAERWRGNDQIDVAAAELLIPQRSEAVPEDPGLNAGADAGATLTIPAPHDVRGFVDVHIESVNASFVEVYAVNTASINSIFLGLARKSSDHSWTFNWDTTQLPNSRYHIFARVDSPRGLYESNRTLVTVMNERAVLPTADQVQALSERTTRYEELLTDSILMRDDVLERSDKETLLTQFLAEHQDRLQADVQLYAAAIRSGNVQALTTANTNFIGLENAFRDFVRYEDEYRELVAAFNEHIETIRARIERDVDMLERIMNERTDEDLFVDSDMDGISDFDEIYIYGTDPFLADTGGSGIPDGVAILNGINPRSTTPGVPIVFESPRNIGIIQDDVLQVESVTAVTPDEQAPEIATDAPAVISGRALPNSFVTLFIFSTPVIVTVKTEADGSWQYRFEKELEDGEHTVYVAMTDNSGRIIARSSGFRFVKEAQAYTAINEALENYGARQTTSNTSSLLSTSVVYLVLSFAVVGIGLVLLLLGMYMNRRQEDPKSALL